MTTPIDDKWIAQQEAICAKASKGPWQPEAMFDRAHPEYIFPQYVTGRFDGPDWRKNFDFIASARTALPLALAELRRLREIVGRLPKMADGTPIVPGAKLYAKFMPNRPEVAGTVHTRYDTNVYYPTEQAALAARERGE